MLCRSLTEMDFSRNVTLKSVVQGRVFNLLPYLHFLTIKSLMVIIAYGPAILTTSKYVFCIYGFCIIPTVNSYYFLKHH
jgi:hypothetical protein